MRSKERFSQTVEDYVKYRPTYPKKVIEILKNECDLTTNSVLADVGFGTGLLTKLLLENGNFVYGIEPNESMRKAGEKFLQGFSKFESIAGSAEETSLASNSINIITVGTAFHWFDPIKTKTEFQRILKSPGWVMLVWNVRNEAMPLIKDYEKLITEFGRDYKDSAAQKFDESATANFFAPFEMHIKSFPNSQQFDWEGFKGRLLSTSYSLREGQSGFDKMIAELKTIFNHHQKNNKVDFDYVTKLYYGRLR